MQDQPDDTSKGDRALVADLPVVELHGEPWQLKRLGVESTIRLVRLISASVKNNRDGMASIEVTEEGISGLQSSLGLTVLLDVISQDESTTISLLAQLLGVDIGQIRDPDFMGPAEMLRVFKALPGHPDFTRFFIELGWAPKGRKAAQETTPTETSSEHSTPSNADTDGQTKPS